MRPFRGPPLILREDTVADRYARSHFDLLATTRQPNWWLGTEQCSHRPRVTSRWPESEIATEKSPVLRTRNHRSSSPLVRNRRVSDEMLDSQGVVIRARLGRWIHNGR